MNVKILKAMIKSSTLNFFYPLLWLFGYRMKSVEETIEDSQLLKISKCKCGAEVEFGWGIATDSYGVSWQNCGISCPGTCGYSVSMTINANSPEDVEDKLAEENIIKMWNTIQFSS